MERHQFYETVMRLRDEGKSIRGIAAEIGVHRSRVHRALKSTTSNAITSQSENDEIIPATNSLDDVFVGRQMEMDVLGSALLDALAGQGRLITLAGDPGIGKTRTSQELTTIARQRGAVSLWGRCYEGQGAPPYWPWVEIMRSFIQEHDENQLRSFMGAGAPDIAQLVPEAQEMLPDLEPPAILEPEQARFRLLNSIASFLKRAARSQPLMIVLDNLHRADRPSLLLLEFLAQEIAGVPIMILGTYRETELSGSHSLKQTLAEMARGPHFHQLFLRGLTQEDVGHFIAHAAGTSPSLDLVEAVHSRTEGNPFFITQVMRLLAQEGELNAERMMGQTIWRIQIPDSVRNVIGRRMDRLSRRCNKVLTIASVIGREFDFRLLGKLNEDISEDELLDSIDEALEAHVIEELSKGPDRYQFSHVLIQQTLYEELSKSRASRLHARIGGAIEELCERDLEAHASELAHHFGEAAATIGSGKLVQYSGLAGESALSTYAYEEALSHFERALAAKEGYSLDSETAALLFGLGRAQAALLQLEEAMASLSRAFDYYAQIGDIPKALAVAEHPLPAYAGRFNWASQLSARALELVPPDSHEAGRLLSNYVRLVGFQEADYAVTIKAFDRALAIAQRESDTGLEMRTLANGAMVDVYHWRFREGLEKSGRAIEMTGPPQRVEDPQAEAVAHYTTSIFLFLIGDSEGASAHAAAGLLPAEKVRDRSWLSRILWANQIVPRLQGDWATARAISDRALLTVWPRDPRTLFSRAAMEYEVGEFSQGEGYLERLIETMRLTSPGPNIEHSMPAITIPAVARVTGSNDHLDVAERAAKAVLSSQAATPLMSLLSRMGLALLAVHHNDAAAAREYYAALEAVQPFKQTMPWLISGDRLLGLLAQTMENIEESAGHFEDALNFCRKAGYRPELAWVCYDYAALLAGRHGRTLLPDARKKTASLLGDALAITIDLGMVPLKEKVVALRESSGAARQTTSSYPDRLTPREVEVLRLIAAGKTNQEIADELFISLKTVTNHVTSILNKTNSTNRAQATSYAHTHGLV